MSPTATECAARQEFRQSFDEDGRAEFINGDVVAQSPAAYMHSTSVHLTGRLLSIFVDFRLRGAVRLLHALSEFTRNDFLPDISYWKPVKAAAFKADTIFFPVPDFVAEVLSPNTEARDRGVKFDDYAAHGVGEYWIIDPEAHTIEQFLLSHDRYELAGRFADGSIRSTVITGLEFPVLAAFDDQANLTALRQLLAAP